MRGTALWLLILVCIYSVVVGSASTVSAWAAFWVSVVFTLAVTASLAIYALFRGGARQVPAGLIAGLVFSALAIGLWLARSGALVVFRKIGVPASLRLWGSWVVALLVVGLPVRFLFPQYFEDESET